MSRLRMKAIREMNEKDLKDRVGVLERWRWLLIGGCIVIGFALHKLMNFSIVGMTSNTAATS